MWGWIIRWAVVLIAILAVGFRVIDYIEAQEQREHEQTLQQSCLDAGGSWIYVTEKVKNVDLEEFRVEYISISKHACVVHRDANPIDVSGVPDWMFIQPPSSNSSN